MVEARVGFLCLEGNLLRVMVAANPDLGGRLQITLQIAGIACDLVTDAADALQRLRSADVIALTDIALLDYDMAGLAGTRAIQQARAQLGERPLGVVYGLAAPAMAQRALSAGATGVLPDDLDPAALAAALALLADGTRFAIFGSAVHFAPFDAGATLTDRELQVLHGVCDGLQNKEIAHRFSISEVTVKMHVRAVISKLGARNRTHAAMIARDLGIV